MRKSSQESTKFDILSTLVLIGITVILYLVFLTGPIEDKPSGKEPELYSESTSYNDLEENLGSDEITKRGELISIPNSNLAYDSIERTVYYLFHQENINQGYGFMGKYLVHGHTCEYHDGQIEMLHINCGDACEFGDLKKVSTGGELIMIPNSNLAYDSVERTVYYLFHQENINQGYGYMDEYLIHGHTCEYVNGKIEMLHVYCDDFCEFRDSK